MKTDNSTIQHWAHDWRVKNSAIFERIKKTKTIEPAIWKQLGQDGLLGVQMPEKWGGSGLSLKQLCCVIEEIAYQSPSLALSMVAHSNLFGQIIAKHGSTKQQAAFLPAITSGSMIGAIGISEDTAGSDALAMRTSLTPDGDNFRLNGHKMWITNGPIADIFVVYARNHLQEIKAVIVPKSDHLIQESPLDKFGMQDSPTGRISFDNILIQPDLIIPGDGKNILKSGLHEERVLLSSIPIGIMRKAMDEMLAHTISRQQFGSSIASKQLVQQKLACAHVKLAASQALLSTTLAGSIDAKNAASCYLMASQSATEVANMCLDIMGGYGYMNESNIGQLLADAKLFQTGGGTESIRALIIGHALTGMRAY